jgi:hypothetical protein
MTDDCTTAFVKAALERHNHNAANPNSILSPNEVMHRVLKRDAFCLCFYRWLMDFGLGANATRQGAQSVGSLNPRPLKIIGTHFSARAARVFGCFAPET